MTSRVSSVSKGHKSLVKLGEAGRRRLIVQTHFNTSSIMKVGFVRPVLHGMCDAVIDGTLLS